MHGKMHKVLDKRHDSGDIKAPVFLRATKVIATEPCFSFQWKCSIDTIDGLLSCSIDHLSLAEETEKIKPYRPTTTRTVQRLLMTDCCLTFEVTKRLRTQMSLAWLFWLLRVPGFHQHVDVWVIFLDGPVLYRVLAFFLQFLQQLPQVDIL